MEHHFCPYCMAPVEEGKPCGACGLTQGSYTPSPHHLPPGTVLKERYLVGRVLGEGGFGITYIGCDLQLELKVAIKEYFPTDKASRVSQASLDVASYTGAAGVNYDKGLKKFLQEARTIARMDKQPVIVNVRDFFEINHTAYIVMEYVEGTTFKELVEQRGGRIPAGELLYLIEPLFFALKEMHGNGLIHRDISPENLMLEKGEVRLLDFGCARESADGGNTLTIALKHGYAPVEQYQSKGQGPWTDVYALAATLYYCLTGRKPPQAMDRLVEDELIPPRKLGVDLTQQQEKALLYGMGVPPKRRFQSMEEFHTALYEGFVPGAQEEARQKSAAAVREAPPEEAERGETAGEADSAGPAQPSRLAAWLRQNRLLAGGIAAAAALAILLSAVLPRLLGPSAPDGTPVSEPAEIPGESAPSDTAYRDHLARIMETAAWLRQDDVEVEEAELRERLEALPIDLLFADAVRVTTLAELEEALSSGDRPVVIAADLVYPADRESSLNSSVPVLVSEGVTVTVPWENYGEYENAERSEGGWTVDGSLLINRGTIRGQIHMGDWDSDGETETNLLVNYGTLHSDLGAGYEENSYNMVVNLNVMSIPRTQFRMTSFYNLGTLLHGMLAPEGETPMVTTPKGGDYFIDLIGCYFYNGGEIVLEGRDEDCRSRLDVADNTRFVNAGTIRLGAFGELNQQSTLLNRGEITAEDSTAQLNNRGWLWNTGTSCAMDRSLRCENTGLVQAGLETPVDLSAVRNDGGGAVLPFGWYDGWEEPADVRIISSEEEFHQALEDRSCTLIGFGDSVSLTLTGDLILTKGLVIPSEASLTMEGARLTVAGEGGYLCANGPIDLRSGVFTVRDEAVASVCELRDCGGVTLKNQGYLMLRSGLRPNDGAVIELSDARYLCSAGPLELHEVRVSIENALLRGLGGVELYGCTVEIGEPGEFLTDGCGVYFDPDTVITNRGGIVTNGWGRQEYACRLTNYGSLQANSQMLISGSLVNHGHCFIWSGGDERARVSGSLENHGTVEIEHDGRLQIWAAGTITGVPKELIAD